MALSFRRESQPDVVEALVFADDDKAFDELAHDLDIEFGAGQWELVVDTDADTVLASPADADFAVFAVSSEESESIERIAGLIRLAAEAGLMVVLVVGEISSRSMHRLLREGAKEFVPYPDTEPLGPHPLGDLVQATWAIAAATT